MEEYLRGVLGFKGERGYSAYEIALKNGFVGSEKDWLSQLGTTSHFSEDSVVHISSANQTSFELPATYVSNSMIDVYVNGFKLNVNEYTIDENTMQINLATALDEGAVVEIVVKTMGTNKIRIKHYNSVSSMKIDTTIENANMVHTLGYYEVNDGGAADYIVREKTENDVEDNGSIHFLDNGLVAELIIEDGVNVEQFGAKGDGVNDDTEAIQKALDSGFKVVLNPKKKYMFSKTLNITKPIILEGNYADLTYTGTETGIYFNAENIESHKRDMGIVNNIMLHSPNGDKAIDWNYAIKTVLRNIKIYDFKHYGIYFKTPGYESRFENIYLVARKTNNTVGIYGNIADMDFGALYGMNVEKFMEITGTATNIELVHAWCANLSIFEDEPVMSEETYKEWFNNTTLFHFKQNANDFPLNFNYVYADTYNTVIKWESYHRNTTFKTLSLRGSNKLIESENEYIAYSVYIGIENLFANLSILSDENYYPTISKVNNFKVSKAIVRTIGDKTVKIPMDRIKYFDEEVTGDYNRVLSGIMPLSFIYSQYNFGGDAKTGFPHFNSDNGNTTFQASLSGTYYVRLLLQAAPIKYGSTFCYVANDNSI